MYNALSADKTKYDVKIDTEMLTIGAKLRSQIPSEEEGI